MYLLTVWYAAPKDQTCQCPGKTFYFQNNREKLVYVLPLMQKGRHIFNSLMLIYKVTQRFDERFGSAQWRRTCHYMLFICIVSVHLGVIAKQPDLVPQNIKECLTSDADLLVHAKGS